MTLGKSPTSEDAFRSGTSFCRHRVSETSIYGLLYRESHRLFPDDAFADLFADIGRASVPPRIVAVVMVLQRLEGLSDREAVDRIAFDLRWKYAAGGLDFDYAGFVHTVLGVTDRFVDRVVGEKTHLGDRQDSAEMIYLWGGRRETRSPEVAPAEGDHG